MKLSEKEIQGLLPNLKNLPGLDPRVELRVTESFRRVYEFFTFKLREQEKAFDDKLAALSRIKSEEVNNARTILTQPLVAAPTTEQDFELQSISGPASQLNANGTILDVSALIDGEYIRRIGNQIVSGFPVGTTSLIEGVLDAIEASLYVTPINHKTKMRFVLLFNNTAGPLTATIRIRDLVDNLIFGNNYILAGQEKMIITLNQILPTGYTLNGFASFAGGIEYSLFGIEETLT